MSIDWKRVAIDALIVFLLTAVGGFIIGVIAGVMGTPVTIWWLALSNLLLATAGFAYSSYKVRMNRWQHLCAVAFALWILSLVNLFLGVSTFKVWLMTIIPIAVFMGIGGVVGMLAAKRG